MSRAIKLFMTGFLTLVILTGIGLLLFDTDDNVSSGPVTQLEIYHPDWVRLDDIDPTN